MMAVRPVALALVFLAVCFMAVGLPPGPAQAASPAPDPSRAAGAPVRGLTSVVPPPPGSVEWLRAQKRALPDLSSLLASPSPVSPRSMLGNVRLLVILVDFSDRPATVTNLTLFDNLIFASPVAGRGSVRDYYDEVSHSRVTLVTLHPPSATGWQRATHAKSYYANSAYGIGNTYPQNAGHMVEDVLPLVDPLVDFSQYDNDGDGWVDTVLLIHAGTGGEFSLNSNDIWSHGSSISLMGGNQYYGDGVGLDSYVTVPEYWVPTLAGPAATDMTIGVICHEIAHGLWGLPDLYDLDLSSLGIGTWGLMSYGDWNGPAKWNPFTSQWITDGSSPAWPDAFSRVVAGFDGYTLRLVSGPASLSPAETTADAIIRLKSSRLQPQEYFLLENRQPFASSYDEYLPGGGLLIWHIDESQWSAYQGPDNSQECSTLPHCMGSCWNVHYLAALEQADGADHLERMGNYGDAADPLPGTGGRTSWQPYGVSGASPESGSWNDSGCGKNSCLDVTGIACPALGTCALTINQAACGPAEADLGDAPASANHAGLPMTAYPVPYTPAGFPTVWGPGLGGPRHHFASADAWLGAIVSGEAEADRAPDLDGTTNISPTLDVADMDGGATGPLDDGLQLPVTLAPCAGVSWPYNVTVVGFGLHMPPPRYVNAWLDWNHDGDWADTLTCPGGVPAPEWALQDHESGLWPGSWWLPSLPIVAKIDVTEDMPWETWLRLSIAEMRAPPPYDGRGPAGGYDLGETEDYRLWLMPGLSKVAQAPAELEPGDVITYQLTLASSGNVVGAGAVLSDVLPAGVTYLSSTPSGTYDPATRTVRWDVTLTPGTNTVLTLKVTYTGERVRVINTAAVLWGGTVWRRASATVVGGHVAYLPLVLRHAP